VTGAVVFEQEVVVVISNDITLKEKTSSTSIKYSDKKLSSGTAEKLREPMIKYKHLPICSGATLIRSVVHTSDKRIRESNPR
jgi:rRNA-processing protein FCF1